MSVGPDLLASRTHRGWNVASARGFVAPPSFAVELDDGGIARIGWFEALVLRTLTGPSGDDVPLSSR